MGYYEQAARAKLAEIERLKARAVVLESEVERRDVIIREHIYGVVDAKMKIKQAMAILSGEDQ